MARGRGAGQCGFGRVTGVTGVIGGASAVQIAVTGAVSPLVIAASLLTIVWLVLVGRDLLRAYRPPPSN